MTEQEIEDVWEEYYHEVVMNSVVMVKKVEVAVPIDDSGEATLRLFFNRGIKVLIEHDEVPWDPSPGPVGVARRFILSTAAAIGRFASKMVGARRDIDKEAVENAFDALARDWEKVCPLPIAKVRESCPIPPIIPQSRALPYPKPAHAGSTGRKR